MNVLKQIYVFIGPPGSGKGTLSAWCKQYFGWEQLSTGNLCRQHITEQTEIGKQIDFALKSGKLVSDSLISCLVDGWFKDVSGRVESVIFDGYPRTIEQAKLFHQLVKNNGLPVKIVRFDIDSQLIITRLTARFVCTNEKCQAVYSQLEGSPLAPKQDNVCDYCQSGLGRRSDDTLEVIKERLAMYYKHENELLQFCMQQGYPVVNFDVNKNLHAIFEDFKQLAHGKSL